MILNNPLHIALIAVPLVIQTYLIFFIAYLAGKKICLPHDVVCLLDYLGFRPPIAQPGSIVSAP